MSLPSMVQEYVDPRDVKMNELEKVEIIIESSWLYYLGYCTISRQAQWCHKQLPAENRWIIEKAKPLFQFYAGILETKIIDKEMSKEYV